jgi:tetratricopeptide (TPR) repeat protein
MKRKKEATKVLQSESEFLRDAPSEIQAVLAWFHDGAQRARLSDEMEHFAGGFLAALYDDGALFPMSKNAAWLLAMVLTQHQRNPTQPIAWLNLGLALRRMALYRTSDPESLKSKWIDRALQSLDRSLELEPKNVRAWTGRGLVFLQLGRHEEEAQCYRRSLDMDSSDPGLWLLYVNALQSAGKEDEAAANLDRAYQAYLLAGEPEELQEIFGKFGPGVQADLTQIN